MTGNGSGTPDPAIVGQPARTGRRRFSTPLEYLLAQEVPEEPDTGAPPGPGGSPAGEAEAAVPPPRQAVTSPGQEGAGESGPGALPVRDATLEELPELPAAVESILLVVDEPITVRTLAQVLGESRSRVERVLRELAAGYLREGRGFELREVAGGWRFYTATRCAPVVERFVLDGQQARLTQAALETLAVVAYRQPVSRARVSAVRGVNVDGVMRTLLSRGLVEEAGTDPVSGAVLYRTTSYFLERLGLRSLDELPALAPFLPEVEAVDDEVPEPTVPAPPGRNG